jgi:integrase/recombinase XerC
MAKIKAIEGFIAYQKSQDKSPLTISSYQSDLVGFIKWFEKHNAENFSLTKMTPTDARHYKQHLLEQQYKPQTIIRRLLSLKYLLEWAWNTKRIKYKFPLPKLVKQNQVAPKWLNRIEQNALLRHFERYAKSRDLAIVKLLLNTGLRVQELCNLKWQDVSVTSRKGHLIIRQGKGNKYREVPLNKDARDALQNLGCQEYAGQDKFVFIGQRGPLSPRGVQLMLKRILGNGDLNHITPHQLRHTFCKNLVDADVTLEKVAALAGHESLDTTRIYCQPSLSDLNDAVNKIGEAE